MQKFINRWVAVANTFPRTFKIIIITTFIDRLGGSMLFPFFALYLTDRFEVGLSEVGWLFLIFSITGFIGSFAGGALTDRFGRRKMIIFSLVASSSQYRRHGSGGYPSRILHHRHHFRAFHRCGWSCPVGDHCRHPA